MRARSHARTHARTLGSCVVTHAHARARTRTCAVNRIESGSGIACIVYDCVPSGRDVHRRDGRQLARHSAAAGHPPYRSRECGAQSRILWPQHLGTAALGRLRFSARPHSAPRLPCRGDRLSGACCMLYVACCTFHVVRLLYYAWRMLHSLFPGCRCVVSGCTFRVPTACRLTRCTLGTWRQRRRQLGWRYGFGRLCTVR